MRAGRWIAWGLAAPVVAVLALVTIDSLRWQPARSEIDDLRARGERLTRELRDVRAAASRPDAEIEARRIEEELERLGEVLPDHVSPGETTARVRRIADDLGIELRTLGEERRSARERYTEVRVSFAFSGDLDRLEAFEDAIAEARPLARVVAILRNPEGVDAEGPPLWSVSVAAYQIDGSVGPDPPPPEVSTAGG